MITIKDEGIILEPTTLDFESYGVFNPACIRANGIVHMFYRAVKAGNSSCIGYCQLQENKVILRLDTPVLFPEYEYEKQGVEDPRITYVDGVYYLFYTAYDGNNARVAYATSTDLVTFKKHGPISPDLSYHDALLRIEKSLRPPSRYFEYAQQVMRYNGSDVAVWDKDAFIFPKKINGQFVLIHRIMPSIQVAFFKSFEDLGMEYWAAYFDAFSDAELLNPAYAFENRYIGGGCPPIETSEGWLLIYHGVQRTESTIIYSAGAALLDLENPKKIIGRLPYPLFSPMAEWEKRGNVDNVVFPTGAIIEDSRLYIYYGAADTRIACKSLELQELIAELKANPPLL